MSPTPTSAKISALASPGTPSGRGRTPVKAKAARAANAVLSPNNDETERAAAREKRAAEQQLRRAPSNLSTKHAPSLAAPAPTLSANQIVDLYSNCLKLASENKINAKNSWSLPLIDHIAELVKPEHSEGEDYNFQKASCTLDAGVKIYGCRVDSVHTEAYKVLAGVSRTAQPDEQDDGADGDGEGEGSEDGGAAGAGEKKARKRKQSGPQDAAATLETNPDALNLKRDASGRGVGADPLFQRMSSRFDAGGPRGLLLYNLAPHKGVELLFDSADAPTMRCAVDASGDVRVPVASEAAAASPASDDAQPCTRLSAAAGALEAMLGAAPGGDEGDAAAVVMTPVRPGSLPAPAVCPDSEWKHAAPLAESDDEDAGGNDAWADDDGGFAGGADDDSDDEGSPGGGGFGGGDPFANGGLGEGLALARSGGAAVDWLAAASSLSGKSWIGAAHWRYKAGGGAATSNVAAAADAADEEDASAAPKRTGFIDFNEMDLTSLAAYDGIELAEDTSAIALAASAAAGDAIAGGANAHLLPPDLGVTPRDLASLSLRPGHVVRGGTAAAASRDAVDHEAGGLDAWDGGDFGAGGFDDDDDDDDDNGGDLGGFGFGDLGADDHDLDGVREVDRVDVAYDRKARHVDVAAVKASMWESLDETRGEPQDFAPLVEHARSAGGGVHVAFICLLHLCNEKKLELRGCEGLDALTVEG